MAYNDHDQHLQDTDVIRMTSLDELLANADIISLHCPLVPTTKEMINKDSIKKMKEGVILINTSQGPLIVEEDLKTALDSGKITPLALTSCRLNR